MGDCVLNWLFQLWWSHSSCIDLANIEQKESDMVYTIGRCWEKENTNTYEKIFFDKTTKLCFVYYNFSSFNCMWQMLNLLFRVLLSWRKAACALHKPVWLCNFFLIMNIINSPKNRLIYIVYCLGHSTSWQCHFHSFSPDNLHTIFWGWMSLNLYEHMFY